MRFLQRAAAYFALVSGYFPGLREHSQRKAVRDLLEDLEGDDIVRGMETAIYNSRGVVSRDLLEGGEQERRLVDTYQDHARVVSDRWPRTAALLRRIADIYYSEARKQDLRAQLREDLWR